MTEPLAQGAVIGILGGGQLGRMLAMAAARLGYRTHIFEPGAAPAADVAAVWTKAAYDDASALRSFAEACDIVTYEFENIPATALDILGETTPFHPNRRALEISQDRLAEKEFLSSLGLAVAPFAQIDGPGDLSAALEKTGIPAILKTRRFGYDGKGQARVLDHAGAQAALGSLEGAPAIAEGFVTFSREISVIAARGADGSIAAYDPGENVHVDGILATTTVPAAIPAALRTDAVLLASRILNALDYVGVLGVELFVTPGGLVVNEIAPRVHNSGHWTQAGCAVDQFEQHIRAIAGWPLGDGTRHANVVMENLIGADVDRAPALAAERGVQVHLYGKTETRPGRKMGHVNRVTGPAG
ncbi:5-(carboxyamino)imidazole ribonucleotide synthase [Roseibacterium sp. SDUM158016]|jgi:5-(carboxyamino)imidazole ribonucleotide synthase|uniref:5-(carboxyamino)imidazole ribonucleotide synthase n=1 Tax=Roseicyclus sediminis TaxID=2980997 RepID=UPI0021D011ED|nr:5-(carboxyamino)imidazole ribonucleotide synthase [Roseibacterium sp. SDUM158016]MCU4654938.1 5-(carboxyamino)imidazole ribonucleotide synthase [Roseibacterium sp. SDUM158016]